MMSFQERSKLGMENLSKQLPVTLEQARKQALLQKREAVQKGRSAEIKRLELRYWNFDRA
jgi:hypothetical protein